MDDQEHTIPEFCEEKTINSADGGSFMSFLLGGLFANLFMPRKQKPIPMHYIPDSRLEENHSFDH